MRRKFHPFQRKKRRKLASVMSRRDERRTRVSSLWMSDHFFKRQPKIRLTLVRTTGVRHVIKTRLVPRIFCNLLGVHTTWYNLFVVSDVHRDFVRWERGLENKDISIRCVKLMGSLLFELTKEGYHCSRIVLRLYTRY